MANNPTIVYGVNDYVTTIYSIGEGYPYNPLTPDGTDASKSIFITPNITGIDTTQLLDSLTKIATQILDLTKAFHDLSEEVSQLQKDMDALKKELGV